jgi:hypothetical protein
MSVESSELRALIERLRREGENSMRKHLSLGMHSLCAEAADALKHLTSPPPRPTGWPSEEEVALALMNETRAHHGLDPIEWTHPAIGSDHREHALRKARAVLALFPDPAAIEAAARDKALEEAAEVADSLAQTYATVIERNKDDKSLSDADRAAISLQISTSKYAASSLANAIRALKGEK